MASSEIPAANSSATQASANPVEGIHASATELQTLASRVISLAQAANDVSSHIECGGELGERHRQSVNSIINFAELIEQEARAIIAKGELIERASYSVVREAVQ